MLMGDAFGKSYQYGKRKISAMSNEEFNELTPKDLAKDITADFEALIPELKIAMAASTEFQGQIIREMGAMLQNFLADLPADVKQFILGLNQGGGLPSPIGIEPPPDVTNIFHWAGQIFKRTFIFELLKFMGVVKE